MNKRGNNNKMIFKTPQHLGLLCSTFIFSFFFSTAIWAVPNASPASTDNLKVYLEQIIGPDDYRNYKNIQ